MNDANRLQESAAKTVTLRQGCCHASCRHVATRQEVGRTFRSRRSESFQSWSNYLSKKWVTAMLVWLVLSTTVIACNIPVFRYALERWRPDTTELILFVDSPLDTAQAKQLQALGLTGEAGQAAGDTGAGGAVPSAARLKLNIVDASDLDEATPKLRQLAELWTKLSTASDLTLPYVVLRNQSRRGPIYPWHGPLSQATREKLLASPARVELGRRLLRGDSIVWLLLKSEDRSKNEAATALLNKQLSELSDALELPEGVGLPGSELFSPVPLLLKFTILEVERSEAKEELLINFLRAHQPEAFEEGEPLLVPVFGRGRALEVIPADQLDERLIMELSAFLCGACSCQVKEQNPGFDLLLDADWEQELFGEGGEVPVDTGGLGIQRGGAPQLLTIPPGR